MKHFLRRSHLDWIVVLGGIFTLLLFLNPFGLQGVRYDDSQDILPLKGSVVTDLGGAPASQGFPLQYWYMRGPISLGSDHYYLYFNYTLVIIDLLFWLTIVATIILSFDAVLARLKPVMNTSPVSRG